MKTKNIQVIRLNSEHYKQWDNFVDESPQGDVFCYSWWLEAITKGNFKIFAIFEKDKILAGIPLAYYFGKINEPPLTRTLGPLFRNLQHLSEHNKTTLQRQWLNLLFDQIPTDEFEQFCTSHNFTDWLVLRWRGLKQMTRYTYLIVYKEKSKSELWSLLSRGRKETITKARKNKISVKITNDLFQFYELILLTYQRQGIKFWFSFEDFKLLDDEIANRDRRRIITAFDEQNHAHAAIYLVYNQKSAFALLSAGNPQFRHLGGHTLVMWEAIKYFYGKVDYFNFGGSDIERIENHLRGFGGIITPYFHIYKEKPIVQVKEITKEIEVVKEIPVIPPLPPDDWKYHVNLISQHSWLLVKKALYKINIRFSEPIKVSVITPCYNHGKYIHEMIESIIKQTYQNFEVIIVNDGSTDDTADILNGIKHKKIKVIHTENFGPAHARNLAINLTKGEFIINLDADDKIAPCFIQRCVEIMTSRSNVGIVYSNVELFGYKNEPFVLQDYSFENMLRANCIIANACFRRSDWVKTEGYSSVMKYGYEDFDFWLSILELGRDIFQIKEYLIFYRTYEKQEASRSGRRKRRPDQMEEAIVQAFQRHKRLYEKIPHIYSEFCEIEDQFKLKKEQQLKDPTHPVFSIITPTNNRPKLLKRAIESVLGQSFSNWEQIIVDDANDPETSEIVTGMNDPRLKYVVHEMPKGAAGAYNTGIQNARGRFINFLDDDDEYLSGILEKIYNSFEEATNNPGFIWTGIIRVQDTENREETIRSQVWPADFNSREEGLMVSTAIGNGFGLSVKKECVEAIGLYDENLVVGEDTDFMIRLSEKFNFRSVPEILVKIHHHGSTQLTHKKYSKLRWDSYKRILNRHFDFLSQHWDTLYIHNNVFSNLCYQLDEKKEGRKSLLRLIINFPTRKITWLDLFSYEKFGTDYNNSKIKNWVGRYKILLLSIGRFGNTIKNAVFYFINIPASSLNTMMHESEKISQRIKDRKFRLERKKPIKTMDEFRKNYDNIPFDLLVQKSNVWLYQNPEQFGYTLPHVQSWIDSFVPNPAFILEIGGWRGDLAYTILNENNSIHCWDNYDVISDSSTQKCLDLRYHHIPLKDYIWNLRIDDKYNALIATHMIQCIKWHELVDLIQWISGNIQTVLFEAPLVKSAENYNWNGHHSTHVLEKGWEQVIIEMRKHNFVEVFSEKDTVIFIRDQRN